MNIERALQIQIAALTTIGAVLLGMGQQASWLPLLGVLAAFSSVLFTDTWQWFHLHRAVGNVAAVAALFVSLSGFFDSDTKGQLGSIASLLIYMQVVLFYQRKSPRVYWQLALLSLLQVVVATALNVRFEFGVLLVLYATLAISTLAFLFVHRELLRVAEATSGAGGGRRRTWSAEPAAPGAGRVTTPRLNRRPVISSVVAVESLSRAIVGWGFAKQIAGLGVTTFVFAVVLFFAAPRLESSARRSLHTPTQHVVGFSSEVRLGDLDEILQSDETVMRVSFREPTTNLPYRVSGDPYIRGSILTNYVCRDDEGRWTQPVRMWPPREFTADAGLASTLSLTRRVPSPSRLGPPPPHAPLVRLDVVLEPLEEPVVFGVFPAYRLPETPDSIRYHPVTEQLLRNLPRDGEQRTEFRYTCSTTGFRGGLQIDATPHVSRLQSLPERWLLEQEKTRLLQFDADRFPRLAALADTIVRAQQASPADHVAVARALRNHFQVPGRYTYSLDFRNVPRQRKLDPIEDFVTQHHTGHCAYFASALAMMLRSQGIPSRLVVGFKCDNYNAVGDYYQVLQRQAHVWVEAYLEPEAVEAVVPAGSDTSPGGGWLRLDPTPGADVDKAKQVQQGLMSLIDDGLDYARTIWSDYILGLTAKRQRETIFDPVVEKADPQAWSASWKRLAEQRVAVLAQLAEFWRTCWWLVLAGVVLLIVGLILRVKAKRPQLLAIVAAVRPWVSKWTGRNGSQGPGRGNHQVAFYRRFESLLTKYGATRPASKTPREFAAEFAAQQLACGQAESLGPVMEAVVAAFYRVRYGQLPLDEPQAQWLDAELTRLEQGLKLNGGTIPHSVGIGSFNRTP